MAHRLDYDQLAHLYDEPGRDHQPDPHLAAFLESQDDPAAPLTVLDVGCGTGKQLAANYRQYPGLHWVGVDPFASMVRLARRRQPAVDWVQGDGMGLPLRTAVVDYATNQFSYPHIADKDAFLHEVGRVLRPGGRFVMTNIDPWEMPNWLIYRYFPQAYELDRQDFLPEEAFVEKMHTAGFASISVERRDLSYEQSPADFLAYATDRHRASQLMAIDDAAYTAGLERLRTAVGEQPNDAAPVRSDLVLITIIGNRPA